MDLLSEEELAVLDDSPDLTVRRLVAQLRTAQAAVGEMTLASLRAEADRQSARLSDREVERGDVEAFVAPLRQIPDALERFGRAEQEAALLRAVADELYRLRALAALQMAEEGASLAAIARSAGITRSRAQVLVGQGRELRGR